MEKTLIGTLSMEKPDFGVANTYIFPTKKDGTQVLTCFGPCHHSLSLSFIGMLLCGVVTAQCHSEAGTNRTSKILQERENI